MPGKTLVLVAVVFLVASAVPERAHAAPTSILLTIGDDMCVDTLASAVVQVCYP